MSRQLRVLHVCRRYAPLRGGTERYVGDLAHEGLRRGHEVRVLTLRRDVTGAVPGSLPARDDDRGVEVVRIPGAGNRRAAIGFRPDLLGRAIRDADVVHLHDLRFAFVSGSLFAGMLRRPAIFHTHGLIFHTRSATGLKRFAVRGLFAPLLAMPRARVVASSEPDQSLLVSLAPYLAPRIRLFENAIDLSRVIDVERRPEPGLIVLLGRVAASKGIDDLLRALARVHEPWRLELAGPIEPGEGSRLGEVATGLGIDDRVTLRGPYADGEEATYLARAAGAVFPSPGEGFGLALLEALAAGVPVLANRIAAHEALLGPDLRDRLIDAADPQASARAIESLLTLRPEDAAKIAERSRSRAKQFGITRLGRQIENLYGELDLH
jgi:alpha-1,3-mannosyltransferase